MTRCLLKNVTLVFKIRVYCRLRSYLLISLFLNFSGIRVILMEKVSGKVKNLDGRKENIVLQLKLHYLHLLPINKSTVIYF